MPKNASFETLSFEVQVSSHNPKNLTFTAWRSLRSSNRLDLAIDKAEKVSEASHASGDVFPDRVRVVRVESTCTVLHEIK